jgi:endonuclease YncB( thermonuclease family)
MLARLAPHTTCLAAAILATLAPMRASDGAEDACGALETGPRRTVTRIVDGETVALDDTTVLRLIGALAPRAIDVDAEPGTWPIESVAAAALRELLLGKTVELGFAGARTDRHGRTLAHAFLIDSDGQRRWVQRHLVGNGLARAYASAGARACSALLLTAEGAARKARRGLWAEAAYHVRPADKPDDLLRYRATFQVIEGRVIRVGLTSGTIYLNFDRDWRRAFSVSLRRDDADLVGAYATNPRGLEGRNVRVRGWIEQRGVAPVIDLTSAGAVEILDDTPGEQERRR